MLIDPLIDYICLIIVVRNFFQAHPLDCNNTGEGIVHIKDQFQRSVTEIVVLTPK